MMRNEIGIAGERGGVRPAPGAALARLAAITVVVVGALLSAPRPARAEWLVLVGGTWIHTQGPWIRDRDILRVETVGGLKMQFRMYQIDPQATRKLNEIARAEEAPPPPPPAPAAKPSRRGKKHAPDSREEPAAGAPPPQASQGKEAPPGTPGESASHPDARKYMSNLNALIYCASVYKYDDLAFETCFRTH